MATDNYALYRYSNWKSFTKKWKSLSNQDYRLVDIQTDVQANGKTYYTGAWREGDDKHALYRYNNWKSFTKKWGDLADQGYKLIDVETDVQSNGKTYYTGVWREGDEKQALYRYGNWKSFTNKWGDLGDQGYKLVDIQTDVQNNGKTYYTGVWHESDDKHALYRYSNWKSFTNKWKSLSNQGYRLADVETDVYSNGKTYYTGVWEGGDDKQALYRYNNWKSFTNKWKSLSNQGYRLVDVETDVYKNGKTYYTGVFRTGKDSYSSYDYNDSFKSGDDLTGFDRAATSFGKKALTGGDAPDLITGNGGEERAPVSDQFEDLIDLSAKQLKKALMADPVPGGEQFVLGAAPSDSGDRPFTDQGAGKLFGADLAYSGATLNAESNSSNFF